MIIHERQHRQARRLKSIQGKNNIDILSTVLVMRDSIIYELITQKDIEEACYSENR